MAEKNYVGKNALAHFWLILKEKLNDKVDKVNGKGLSTNDYTTDEKIKLAKVNENAQENIIEKINFNSNLIQITDKTASITETDPIFTASVAAKITDDDITSWNEKQNTITFNTAYDAIVNKAATMKDIPTDNKNLINGAGYQTSSEVQDAINTALEGITGIDFQVVTELPETGANGVIYLKSNGGETPNVYDEYIWLSSASKYEKIGTTEVDLSGYQLSSELIEISNDDIDVIVTNN